MNTQDKINQYEEKIKVLKQKLEQENLKEVKLDYSTIKYKNKEFRIYKWENKPFKDFIFPKEFKHCEFFEFCELFDYKLINYPKENWEVYFIKHWSKRKQEEELIAWVYLDWDGGWRSDVVGLADSDGSGRVVVVRDLK